MTEEACEVVITAPDLQWLTQFTADMVRDRLCAAAHVFPMRTVYRWQGELHDKTEGRAALHTRSSLVPRIVERTMREHPYEVPCVAAFPIVNGSAPYLSWIHAETTGVEP